MSIPLYICLELLVISCAHRAGMWPYLPLVAMEMAAPLCHHPLGAPYSFCEHLFCLQVSFHIKRAWKRLSPELTETRICTGPHPSHTPVLLKCKSLYTARRVFVILSLLCPSPPAWWTTRVDPAVLTTLYIHFIFTSDKLCPPTPSADAPMERSGGD